MAIKIIPDEDIYLTQSEAEDLRKEYDAISRMMAYPPSFDAWVIQRKRHPLNEYERMRR